MQPAELETIQTRQRMYCTTIKNQLWLAVLALCWSCFLMAQAERRVLLTCVPRRSEAQAGAGFVLAHNGYCCRWAFSSCWQSV